MSLPHHYGAVHEIVTQTFDRREFVFGPDTDVVSIADQLGDPELVEWIVEDVQRKFSLEWPKVPDKRGRLRRGQLFIAAQLTVSELAAIVDAGRWPDQWTRPGCYLSDFTLN